jgi:hypothetical protein
MSIIPSFVSKILFLLIDDLNFTLTKSKCNKKSQDCEKQFATMSTKGDFACFLTSEV